LAASVSGTAYPLVRSHPVTPAASEPPSRTTWNGPSTICSRTSTAEPGAAPAASPWPPKSPVSRNGQYVFFTTIFGRVSCPSSSNVAGSPRVTSAAAGTGMIQAAFFDEPRIAIDSTISSVLPSKRTSAFSPVARACDSSSARYPPHAQAQAGEIPIDTSPRARMPATGRHVFMAQTVLRQRCTARERSSSGRTSA
jgi:hypothetical protein